GTPPVVVGVLDERLRLRSDTGDVARPVETTETLDGEGDHRLDRRGIGDVDCDGRGCGADIGRGRLRRALVEVGDHDLHAARRKQAHRRLPDPASTAGDQRDGHDTNPRARIYGPDRTTRPFS